MARKTSLAAALQEAAGSSPSVPEKTEEAVVGEPKMAPVADKSALPPSRQGKKAITGYFDPAVSRQLKQIMLDNDSTMQALLADALNDFFRKHGKKPIA
jgi:hypothetical protein